MRLAVVFMYKVNTVCKIFTWKTRMKCGVYPFHQAANPYLVIFQHLRGQLVSWFRNARHFSFLVFKHGYQFILDFMAFPHVFIQRVERLEHFFTGRAIQRINRHGVKSE